MKIDDHPTELQAMSLFHENKPDEANNLQDEFLKELHQLISSGGDHCPCAVSCKHHGNCLDCVSIHRGHRDHLPDCFKNLLSDKLQGILALTESVIHEG